MLIRGAQTASKYPAVETYVQNFGLSLALKTSQSTSCEGDLRWSENQPNRCYAGRLGGPLPVRRNVFVLKARQVRGDGLQDRALTAVCWCGRV